MHRADVTPKLWEELDRLRALPKGELLALVNSPASERFVTIANEEITIETTVTWADASRAVLRIDAIANGPSTWKLERCQESLLIPVHA